jgi:hypothetical protein
MVVEAVLVHIVCRAAGGQIWCSYWSNPIVSMGHQFFPYGADIPRQEKSESFLLNASFFDMSLTVFGRLANQWHEGILALLQWARLTTLLYHKSLIIMDDLAYDSLIKLCTRTVTWHHVCQKVSDWAGHPSNARETPSFMDKYQFDFNSCLKILPTAHISISWAYPAAFLS